MTRALGIDFGTESARAVLVDCADGRELGTSVEPYAHGVIDARLPGPDDDVELEADWALQDPRDYLDSLQIAVRRLLAETGVPPDEVVGIGIDFTSCTMLPTLADGTPLPAGGSAPRAARVGEAVEAPRRSAGGGPDQRGGRRAG